ncbi:MAG: alpha/beta fold hydrolase [Solirubrobacterales bacterium]
MATGSSIGDIAHLLKGIDFPRNRMEVIEHARRNNAGPGAIAALEALLPDQPYRSMADVFLGMRADKRPEPPPPPAGMPPLPAPVARPARSPLAVWIDQCWQANPLHRLLPIEWGTIADCLVEVGERAARKPERSAASLEKLGLRSMQVAAECWCGWAGRLLGASEPAAAEETDHRFDAPEWHGNPCFRHLRRTYQTCAEALLAEVEDPELDPDQRRRLGFHLRQFIDATSPTLFLATNPAAQRRAVETGGASLADGWRNLLADLEAGHLRMTDTGAFAPGHNLALSPGKVVLRNRLIELIQYSPAGASAHAVPLLIVPPWINKFYILDLQPKNSLVRFLVHQGFTVFIISWKDPDAGMEDVDLGDYMAEGILAASDAVRAITGQERLNAVGYCIGGTLLATTLAWLAAADDHRFNAVTFMVSLLDFSDVGETAVFFDEPHMAYIESQMLERGYLDRRHTANMFNLLRANDLIWNTAVNSYLMGKAPPALDLLYWNADGTRMARAAHAFYLKNTYIENNLVKPGRVVLRGRGIDLGRIRGDVYAIGAEKDHIVPWPAAWRSMRFTSAQVRFVLASSGHIAGMINPPALRKGYYRTNDRIAGTPEQWHATAEHHDGSWWNDWVAWLGERSGEMSAAPPLGDAAHPPLADAPGAYVLASPGSGQARA